MNKKTISMIAMVATIIYTIMYATNQVYIMDRMFGRYFHPTMITTILYSLLTITMLVFVALFFRSNYIGKDDRQISLAAAIFIFLAALWNIISNLIQLFTYYPGTTFFIWNSLFNIFMISMGIFFVFNYIKKSKKQISLVVAIIISLVVVMQLYYLFNGGEFFTIVYMLSYLFYLISLILFFVTVFKSETEPNSSEPEIIEEKPVPAPIRKSVSTVSNDKKGNLTIGEWMLMMFLVSIPIVGLVMLLVWAFESNPHPIKSNWAKANLIWGLIMMLFSFFIILLVVLVTVM